MTESDHRFVIMVGRFSKTFPEIVKGNERNLLFRRKKDEDPDVLIIDYKDKSHRSLAFIYNGLDDYKLMSLANYRKETKAVAKLRAELSKTQDKLKNERRKKKQ